MRRYHDYVCTCGAVFESLRDDSDRDEAVCECGETAKRAILKAPELDPRMGVDPDFATMARRWDKRQVGKATGRVKDSNNTRYGTNTDLEKHAHDMRKLTLG